MGGDSSGGKKRTRTTGTPTARPGVDRCDITITTPLAHVRTNQTADLKPGDILAVDVETVVGKKTIVCRRQRTKENVGFVLARGAVTLIECIEEGNEYTAEVKKVDFGFMEVVIRRSA
jgi:hypothetical protein